MNVPNLKMISKKRATIFPDDDDDVVLDGGGGDGGGGVQTCPPLNRLLSKTVKFKRRKKN